MISEQFERVFHEAQGLLKAGVGGDVFPGATVAIGWTQDGAPKVVEVAGGRLMPDGAMTNADTLYDLASLTRLVVALTAVRLVEAGQLRIDQRADSLIADLRDTHGGSVRPLDLLLHRSGLAPWGALYLDVVHESGSVAAKRWITAEAARRGITKHAPHQAAEPAHAVVISDLGYLLLGELMSKACHQPLDHLVHEWTTQPLGIADEMFFFGSVAKNQRARRFSNAAPTAHCDWRGRQLRGESYDCNCAALGGIAGHAGLFGTARAVLRLGQEMERSWRGESTLWPLAPLRALNLHDPATMLGIAQPLPLDETRRSGPPTLVGMQATQRASLRPQRSILPAIAEGRELSTLTGVSLWWQQERGLVVALLSNRIFPSPNNERIVTFRPAFYNGIVVAFDAEQFISRTA